MSARIASRASGSPAIAAPPKSRAAAKRTKRHADHRVRLVLIISLSSRALERRLDDRDLALGQRLLLQELARPLLEGDAVGRQDRDRASERPVRDRAHRAIDRARGV